MTGSRYATLTGLMFFASILVVPGSFQDAYAEAMVEGKDSRQLIAQLTRSDPRPVPADRQQERSAMPAIRSPELAVTPDSETTDKEESQTDIKESPPSRMDRGVIKEETTAPAALPTRPLPAAKPQPPAQTEPLPRTLPGQSTPPATSLKPLQQLRPIESSRSPATGTPAGVQPKVPSPSTTRPWYDQSTPSVQPHSMEQPAMQETVSPATTRPWYQQQAPGVTTPLPETKQPRFGVPVPREQEAVIDRPEEIRPVQQDVLSPQQQALPSVNLNPCTSRTGDYPIPRVTSYDVRNGVIRGGNITFNGTNFQTGRILVCIGDIKLETVSSSTNQLVVRAPQDLIAGALMISHGTSDSNYVLEENFRIIGDPVITSVEPVSFRSGDQVTVQGRDLYLYPLTTKIPGSATPNTPIKFLKISTTPDNFGEGSFIIVHNYNRSNDMTKITFTVDSVFSQIRTYVVDGQLSDMPSYYGQYITQPEILSGPLRFNSSGTSSFDFAGPYVKWQRDADEFLLTAVKPPAWGDQHPMFVIVTDSHSDVGVSVDVEGSGLDKVRFRVGGELVHGGTAAHGRNGFFRVKSSTPSGSVTATKNDVTVSYPEPLTIIPGPAFLPGTLPPSPFTINIDESYELRGWDLQPSNIPDLTYRLVLSGLNAAAETSCNIRLQIIDHTTSTLRFKVASSGTVPSSCDSLTLFGGTGQTFNVMKLVGEFNGAEKELWRMPYRLAR